MLFSVVIPTYNRSDVILDAINSVLQQEYNDYELIVVDDGSIDNTNKLVAQINDSRLKYIYKENGGVSSARNIGISYASGEYISFLDSDDLWKPNKLLDESLLLSDTPQVNIIFTDLEKYLSENISIPFLDQTKYFSLYKQNLKNNDVIMIPSAEAYLMTLKEVFIKTPALTIKREIFSKYGLFSETLKSGEDWELLLRILEHEDAWFINKQNTIIRVSEDSLHVMHKEQDHNDMIKILNNIRYSPSIEKERFLAATVGISEMYLHLYWFYARNKNYSKCLKVLSNAIKDTQKPKFIVRIIYVLFLMLKKKTCVL